MPRRRLREPRPLFSEDNDDSSAASGGLDPWSLDQLAKSEFFHQKLHKWGLVEIAYELELIQGETLEWNLPGLGITQKAWDKVIHRGIRPIIVFAHPQVLGSVARSVGYYRMLAMVSQKSMNRIGLGTARYEETTTLPNLQRSKFMAFRLNEIISHLIETDEEIDSREFDLWRGMAAGSQAQGSWQNAKGDVVETLVKTMLKHRLQEKQWVVEKLSSEQRVVLSDGRTVIFAKEPDIGIHFGGVIVSAVEVKGGIDTAGVLERIGAAVKSLSRVKESNSEATTILIFQGVSVTPQAGDDLRIHQNVVNHWLTVEDLVKDEEAREMLFRLLGV